METGKHPIRKIFERFRNLEISFLFDHNLARRPIFKVLCQRY